MQNFVISIIDLQKTAWKIDVFGEYYFFLSSSFDRERCPLDYARHAIYRAPRINFISVSR